MAADDKKKAEEAPKADAAPPKKKPPIKLIGAVAGIMLAEAAAVYVLVGMTGAKGQTADAAIHGDEHAEKEQQVEIPLVDDSFQNMQTGRVWRWEIQVVLKVKKKHQEFVETQLSERESEIKEGISQIVRRAQHGYLREPELTTLNRQILAYLGKVIEPDAEGHPRVEKVLIPKCRGVEMSF